MGVFFTSNTASSQDLSPEHREDLLTTLIQCRQIGEAEQRLACFDRAASEIAGAGEIAIVSREDITRDQRSLFGFSAPMMNPFNRGGRTEELQSITATLTSVRDGGRGAWVLTLDDGSVWRAIDSTTPTFSIRRQYPVTVRRAAMGSYMMKVGDTPPFRVRRE
jgi:hypothetical protein